MNNDQIIERAREIMRDLSGVMADLEFIEADFAGDLAALQAAYQDGINGLKREVEEGKKLLVAHMKKYKKALFKDADIRDLPEGTLLYGKEPKVSIPRDALERIEALGWDEAIHTAKAVDRGVVEKWPDEKLVMIGAERKPKETFTYELRMRNDNIE